LLACVKKSLLRGRRTGLPDLFGPNIPKRKKIFQMTTNNTKRPLIIPNGRKIF
jgi:hypothetical protein